MKARENLNIDASGVVRSNEHPMDARAAAMVADLLEAAKASLQGAGNETQALLARVNTLLCPDAIAKQARPVPVRGGLAAWQSRAVASYVDAHLAGPIQTIDLARVAKLSNSHFHRAFRDSFGEAPHAHVLRRRIERARSMMLTTDEPLSQIALACGFSDQSHFTRVFHQSIGLPPREWRRREIPVGA